MGSTRLWVLSRRNSRCASAAPGVMFCGDLDFDGLDIAHQGPSVAKQRLAWCAVQWRAWLSEARRTGRGLVASCPGVDSLKRRDECRECCDYHRDCKKYDGGTVAVPLVTHERPPL